MRQQAADFVPRLERGGQLSLERQLVREIREAIVSRRLLPRMRLPSSRQLARDLQVHRNLVVNALEQLVAEEYLVSKPGSGTYVSDVLLHTSDPVPAAPAPMSTRWRLANSERQAAPRGQPLLDLSPFQLASAAFPLVQWQKVWRQAVRRYRIEKYSTPAGEPGLRAALADYLARTRGVQCTPEELIVTNGSSQAFQLLAQVIRDVGGRVAFEEPGYWLARQVFERAGVPVWPVAVDEGGLCVERLPEGLECPVLVYVTPSHQFPLGVRLSPARRLALLEWAARNDALILEDDYDSELRYDAPPLAPLASLDQTGRVIYVGTFSKVLSPSLRLGYLLAPPLLLPGLLQLKLLADIHTNTPTQLAVEYFITEGHLEQHIIRMRRLYAQKRAVLLQTLQPLQAIATVRGVEAGLHIFVEVEAGVPLERTRQECLRQGIVLRDAARFYAAEPVRQGLVLGYGGLELTELEQAGKQIVSVALGQYQRVPAGHGGGPP